MREWWKPVLIVAALGAPRCSCDPPCSNHSAPNATFEVARGCVGYVCAMTCDPGWLDCDENETNGCETSASVGCPTDVVDASHDGDADAGEPTTAHPIATLAFGPNGLVACAGQELFFDGLGLWSINSVTLAQTHLVASPDPPADGLACDGSYVYWATLSSPDAATPDGTVYRAALGAGFYEPVTTGLDPLSGIDVRDGVGIFVMTSSGLALLDGLDSGVSPWMPAAATGAYKPFVLTAADTWSLDNATVFRRTDDAGVVPWIDDAGMPSALVANGGLPLVVLHVPGIDGGPSTSDILANLVVDDAGLGDLAAIDASVHPVVATSSGATMVVASDDTLYLVSPSNVTVMYTTTDHIVDVAVDGKWVVWTTRGGTSPASVWRGVIP